ncbi:MAG: sigma-70 family RNA polymerase sigma factor [Acidiferrobacterales bacterium]|nr:sigma-70 family RNA polymerase sigma factor [Acidiferrobacterales bacterium]
MNESDITHLLSASQRGEKEALGSLYSLVHDELYKIAQRQMAKSWSVETICATALINESYLKLYSAGKQNFSDRSHFYAVAATAMRQIVLNYAERKSTNKRGGDWRRVSIDQTIAADQHSADVLIDVSKAIDDVARIDDGLAKLIEMRFFAGMTEKEVATVIGVSDRTVRRNWIKAKALLAQSLSD